MKIYAHYGERLIACRNPLITKKNNRQRESILQLVETQLNQIVSATKREKRALDGVSIYY
jgi:hypothetical protein